MICAEFKSRGAKYIIGKEVGEGGTPHLQGYVRFKNQVKFSTVRNMVNGGHFEMAKGSDDDNYTYCSKDNDFVTNMEPPRKKLTADDMIAEVKAKYTEVQWRDWQTDLLSIIESEKEETDERSIHWVWETTGSVGKTYLCRYLACEPDTIICSGKASDVFNQILTMIEKVGMKPALIVADIPRYAANYVSYQALEKCKDACVFSGKYEGGKCVWTPCPIVVCFSNSPPDRSQMSADRWNVYQIKDQKLFKQL